MHELFKDEARQAAPEPESPSLLCATSAATPWVCFAGGAKASSIVCGPVERFTPLSVEMEPALPPTTTLELSSTISELRMESFGEDLLIAAQGAQTHLYVAAGRAGEELTLSEAMSFSHALHGCALNGRHRGELAAVTCEGALYTIQIDGTRHARLVAPAADEAAWHACAFGGHCAALMYASARNLQEFDLRSPTPSSRQLLPPALQSEVIGAIAQPAAEPLHVAVAFQRSLAVLDRRQSASPLLLWKHDLAHTPRLLRAVKHGRRSLLLVSHTPSSRLALHEYSPADAAGGAALLVPGRTRFLTDVSIIPQSEEALASADVACMRDGSLEVLQLSAQRDLYTMRLVAAERPFDVATPPAHPALFHRTLTAPPVALRTSRRLHLPPALLASLLAPPPPPPTAAPILGPDDLAALQEAAATPRTLLELQQALAARPQPAGAPPPSLEALSSALAELSGPQPRPGEAPREDAPPALFRHRVRGDTPHSDVFSRGSLLAWLASGAPAESEPTSAAASFWEEAAAGFSSRASDPNASTPAATPGRGASLSQSVLDSELSQLSQPSIPRLARSTSDVGSAPTPKRPRGKEQRHSQGF